MLIKYSEIRVCFTLSLGVHFLVQVAVTADTPTVKTSEIQVGITQGSTAVLPCVIPVDKDTRHKVIWRDKNGQTLSINNIIRADRRKYSISNPFPNEWNLRINHVRASDDGRYTCSANDTNHEKSRVVVLRVNVPPRILTSGDIDVKEDERLVINCTVSGSPTPVITWFKEKELLPEFNSEILTLDNVQRSDNGEYTCTADNGIGSSDSETFTVDVQYVPKVKATVSHISQYKHKEAVIECLVSANPEGSVTWYKNGKLLSGNWKFLIEAYRQNDGSWINMLTVGVLERQDFGTYVCVAVNDVGSDSSIINVEELTTTVASMTSLNVIKSSTPKSLKSSSSNIPGSTTAPHNGNKENLVEEPDSGSHSPSRDVNLLTFLITLNLFVLEAILLS